MVWIDNSGKTKMISCEEASRLISESFDRTLPFRLRLALRVHLFFCRACRRFRRQLFFVQRAVQELHVDIDRAGSLPSLSHQTRQRMKQALRLAVGGVAPGEA
jgi:hypothetical protein